MKTFVKLIMRREGAQLVGAAAPFVSSRLDRVTLTHPRASLFVLVVFDVSGRHLIDQCRSAKFLLDDVCGWRPDADAQPASNVVIAAVPLNANGVWPLQDEDTIDVTLRFAPTRTPRLRKPSKYDAIGGLNSSNTEPHVRCPHCNRPVILPGLIGADPTLGG